MKGKVDHLQKHIIGICKKADFKSRAKILEMDWEGGTTAAMETTPAEAVNSPLMTSGIKNCCICLDVIMCFEEKRDESNHKLQRITVEVIASFL